MSEPMIQELIDEFRNEVWSEACNADGNIKEARAALLSRITALQQEADEWHKMADRLAAWTQDYYVLEEGDSLEFDQHISSTLNIYRELSQRYPNANPSEDTSVEGTRVKE